MRIARRWDSSKLKHQYREDFASNGFVVLPGILEERSAKRILDGIGELDQRDLWFQACCGDATFVDSSAPPFSSRSRARNFSYRFEQYPIAHFPISSMLQPGSFSSRRDLHGWGSRRHTRLAAELQADPHAELSPKSRLRALAAFLQSRRFLNWCGHLIGEQIPAHGVTAFVSRYQSGSYLSLHSDAAPERICAYVLGLTPFWLPHWGGHLILYGRRADEQARIITPGWNSLLLFSVPRLHVVTAAQPPLPYFRYSCTGWLHNRPMNVP